ncbi:MAG TPA: c-type cytochrome domain-containing protein, partial [Nannocystis sp.]
MRNRLDPIRVLTGVTLATVLNLSLGACSPVVLQDDTDTDGASSGSGGSGGMSSGDTEGADGGGEGTVPEACVDLQLRVLGILETNCVQCHGAGSAGQGGIGYMLDLNELIAQNKVVPGDAEGSRIYARMTALEAPMPPPTETQRPNATDTEIVG